MSASSCNQTTTPRQDSDVLAGASSGDSQQPQSDVSIDEVIGAVTDLFEAKKLQFTAQWQLVGAEAKLLRQSLLVTALATLATFAFACVCWLIINVASAVLLARIGLHASIIATILLAINLFLMMSAWRVAKDAFSHISVNPIVNAIKGESSVSHDTNDNHEKGKQNE